MLRLRFESIARVFCVGAHPDDLEIGCAGAIRRLVREAPGVEIRWHVLSGVGERRREALRSARDLLAGSARPRIRVSRFRESYFPDQWAAIKETIEEARSGFEPDLVFTHYREDRHQDHRVVSDLTWNAFREHAILEYEVPKYDGDLGRPNFYVPLDDGACDEKVTALVKHFRTQRARHWFDEETFRALLRLRGIECGPSARYAEAFYARKIVV